MTVVVYVYEASQSHMAKARKKSDVVVHEPEWLAPLGVHSLALFTSAIRLDIGRVMQIACKRGLWNAMVFMLDLFYV